MAAGLGFKTFQTGEVLTAADTNGYLMQGVLVFANAAARDAAITSPQEGQCCYLKDTDAVLTYSGTAWVGFDDSNAIQNAIINAKGDLIAGSANDTPAILSAGANGETLVADSSTSTGLRYREDYAAGKNAVINGDFRIAQRGTSFTALAFGTYTLDRWVSGADGTPTRTVSQETFTPGTAPVAGYEGANFLRVAQTVAGSGATFNLIEQRIEDVRVFAGETVTVSYWAKADATRTVTPLRGQSFGGGGSAGVEASLTAVSVTTSWQRFSETFTMPSISGKTIGTSSYIYIRFQLPINATFTIDIWGVQLEAGSVATAFQTATGTLAGELAACQRYYIELGQGQAYQVFGVGHCSSTTNGATLITYPVQMRTSPSFTSSGNFRNTSGTNNNAVSALGITGDAGSPFATSINATTTGLTAGNGYALQANNDTTARLKFSAEL